MEQCAGQCACKGTLRLLIACGSYRGVETAFRIIFAGVDIDWGRILLEILQTFK